MVPVVVVNSSLNALGVVRSLAHGRMPIYLVAASRNGAAAWSRYCRFERVRSLNGRELLDGLTALARRIGQRPVLILTGDVEVATISTFREDIAPFFRLSLPSKDMVNTLADKTLFQKFAERAGLPVPRAVVVCEPSDLLLLKDLTFPVVIKPGNKELVLDGSVERAVRTDTLASALATASHMLKRAKRLVVQEWIEGADADIYFTLFTCDSDSHPTVIFSGRKLVCDPPAVGNTAVCIAAPEATDELERMTRQFIAQVGYKGIGSLEFKRNRKDGRFVIVEPTVGRTDWQEEIATLCGHNIPLITYWTEIGQKISDASSEIVQAAWRSSMGYRLPRNTLHKEIQAFDGYFRLSDPLPGLYYYGFQRFALRAYRSFQRRTHATTLLEKPSTSNSYTDSKDHAMTISDTVIVGAGPYGLSIAAHLRAAGLPFQIFGSPLDSWRSFMPKGMILKSEPFASNLWDPQRKFTLERFSRERAIPYQHSGKPVTLATFLEYAEWFRQHAVGDVHDVRVKRLRREGQIFTLDLETGISVKAARVILATGHMAFRYVPPELTALAEPLCLHSTMLGELKTFYARDVTIIGAGQSALESAALLHEAGATVRIVARTERLNWNGPPNPKRSLLDAIRQPESGLALGWRSLAVAELPQVFRWLFPAEKRHRFVAGSWGPSGSWWLRNRFEGRVATLLGRRIQSVAESGGRVRLVVEGLDGVSEIWTDHIIAATGFKIDVDRLDILEPGLRANIAREAQAPLLSAQFETSVPGLFIVGVPSAPTFGPVMRFMFGAKHVAPALVRRLKAAPGVPLKGSVSAKTARFSPK